jgi:hypothetical protein
MKLRTISIALAMLAASALPSAAQRQGDVTLTGHGVFTDRVYAGEITISGAVNDHGTVVDSPGFTGVGGVHITRVMTMSGGEQITLEINGNHVLPGDRPSTTCPRPAGHRVSSTRGNWRIVSATGKYSEMRGNGPWEAWVTHGDNGPESATECLSGHVRDAP